MDQHVYKGRATASGQQPGKSCILVVFHELCCGMSGNPLHLQAAWRETSYASRKGRSPSKDTPSRHSRYAKSTIQSLLHVLATWHHCCGESEATRDAIILKTGSGSEANAVSMLRCATQRCRISTNSGYHFKCIVEQQH